jgi:hypothetical protein
MKYFMLLFTVVLIGSVWGNIAPKDKQYSPDQIPQGIESPVQALHFFDSFEAYVPFTPLCTQTTNWVTWDLTSGGANDPLVSNAQAFNGSNSVVIAFNNDLVRDIGAPVTSGVWSLSWQMYIPTGKAGYFNTLATFDPPGHANTNWGLEVYYNAGGAGSVNAGATGAASFTWIADTWTPVQVLVDLDNDQAEFWYNGSMVYSWQWTLGSNGGGSPLQLQANDFYGATASDEMYFDDYAVEELIPDFLFWDSFDFYAVGVQLALQNPVYWTTWSGTPGSSEDPMVSDSHSSSISNSVVIVENNDLVKTFGSLTTGKWQIELSIYIPTGNSGYFNTLAVFNDPTFNWGMECYFDAGGGGRLLGGSSTAVTFSWTENTWHPVQVIVDLDNDSAFFSFDQTLIHSWVWTAGASGGGSPLQLDANDFFGAAATDSMFVDDYSIILQSPPVIPASIAVDPTAINDSVAVGDSMDVTIEISNTAAPGALALDWSAGVAITNSKRLHIPAASPSFPRGEYPPSMGAAPIDGHGVIAPSYPPFNSALTFGSAWGIEQANGFVTYFDLIIPQVLNNLAADPTNTEFDNAADFAVGDQSYFYNLGSNGQFMAVDTATGTGVALGTILPPGAETWAGMATDPTTGIIYAASLAINVSSTLNIIDPVTLTRTAVGPIGAPGIISLAVDGEGNMWAHDLVTDNFLSIDKNTGASTVVGSLGFDANYGQGMTWDPETDQLYMAAFNNTTFVPELRIVDRTTGGSTLVGVLGQSVPGGLCQLGFLAIPGAGGQVFISLLPPTSGTVDPGDVDNLNVRIRGLDVGDTTYTAVIAIVSNDPQNPLVTIPVEIYVPPVVGINDPSQSPYTFAISQNYPNPFNPTTTIKYQIPQSSQVTIGVYNLLGQKIRTLVNDNMEAGDHQITWNGTNDAGLQVGSGVYFYRFQAGDFVSIKKMMFLK